MQSLLSVLAQRASETQDRMLLNDLAGQDRTYGQFWHEAQLWADALRRLGVGRADVVGIMLPPCVDAFVVQVACSSMGVVCIPLSPLMRGNPLAHAIREGGITTLVTHQTALSGEQLEAVAKAETLARAVLTDVDVDYSSHGIAILGRGQVLADAQPRYPAHADPASPQALILTSGTSGPPKAVQITNAALDGYAAHIVDDPPGGWMPDSGYYSPWAISHALGFIALATAVHRGQRLVVRDGVDLEAYWSDIRHSDIHLTVAVNIAAALWKRPPQPDDHSNPLRVMVLAPVIPEFKEFGRRFGVRIASVYGATEIGPALTSASPTTHRVAGRPTPGYEVRLVDANGNEVKPGTVGELLVSHEHRDALSMGYANRQLASEAAWRDGWYHTGDRFVAIDGEFQFVERVGDSIRHHGRNLSSWQIEEEVRTHSAVEECACVGVSCGRDSQYGADDHDVRLFVLVRPGYELAVADLIDYLRPRLPPYMLPRYYDFVDELPITASGRVQKPQLRQLAIRPDTVDRKSPDIRSRGAASQLSTLP